MSTRKPPRVLFRVEYMEGFGWPKRTRQERTKRTYESREDAARMVATIEALPSHHELIAVWQGTVDWTEIPPLIQCPEEVGL